MHDMPTNDISEWLEAIYDRDSELERLTQETLRLEDEEDVDRLLG
jgi:sporulation-control protein spo0M